MPLLERLRVDLLAAVDNLDGSVSARVYPLTLYPRMDAQYNAFRIDRLELNPATAVIELQFSHANGRTDIFSTFGGGLNQLGDLVENEPMTLSLINLSSDGVVSVTIWVVQYKYNEPRG